MHFQWSQSMTHSYQEGSFIWCKHRRLCKEWKEKTKKLMCVTCFWEQSLWMERQCNNKWFSMYVKGLTTFLGSCEKLFQGQSSEKSGYSSHILTIDLTFEARNHFSTLLNKKITETTFANTFLSTRLAIQGVTWNVFYNTDWLQLEARLTSNDKICFVYVL